MRGSGFRNFGGFRKSNIRAVAAPDFRVAPLNDGARRVPGFRCVLELTGAATLPLATAHPASPAAPTPSPTPRASLTPATPTPRPAAAPSTRPDAALAKATKDAPFINSLGMKFVPVPGTKVLFCIHETRRQDYAAYDAETPGVDGAWKNSKDGGLPCGHENNHPVVRVSWEDAQAFCSWLRKKEGKIYRLPTDREWSFAVGIGHDERWSKDTTPETLSQKIKDEYPWGKKWPPPTGSGNYADATWHDQSSGKSIDGYDDGFATTAPVMSFNPNKLGLYDLGGNVAEWVEDWWNGDQKLKVLRGGCFNVEHGPWLLSSHRYGAEPSRQWGAVTRGHGFRSVVELPAP
jgi:hypothetical protein